MKYIVIWHLLLVTTVNGNIHGIHSAITFNLGVAQGPNPDFPIEYEVLIDGQVNHQEFMVVDKYPLEFGKNTTLIDFVPALLGKREAELSLNIKYDNVLGLKPVKVKLTGRGVCEGYDSDDDLLTDDEEANVFGTHPYLPDSDLDRKDDNGTDKLKVKKSELVEAPIEWLPENTKPIYAEPMYVAYWDDETWKK